MSLPFNANDYRLDRPLPRIRKQRTVVRGFLRGPIPWTWLLAASRLGGKVLHVGIVLWFLVGVRDGE